MSTEVQSYQYVGGREAVDIKLPSGRFVSAARGEVIDDVLPGDAAALDRHPEWTPVEPVPTTAPNPDEEPHE